MSEVIQPAPGQTVITTDHRHHGNHGFDAVEARADFRSIVDGNRALTNEVERFGTQNLASAARTNEIVQAGACRTDSLVQAGFGDTSDRICASTKDITGAVGTGFTAAALAACKTDDAISVVAKDAVTLAKDAIIANNVGFSAQTVQSERIGSAAQVLATAFAGQARDQATMYANAGTVQLERVRAELQAKIDSAASAAVLLATQLDAQARREAEACCCKLTALVIEQGEKTRAQGGDFRMRDLESQLARIPRGIAVTLPVGT